VHTYPLGIPSSQLPFVYANIRNLISTYNANNRDITIISSEGGVSTLNAPVSSIIPSAYSANLTGTPSGINLVTYTEDFT
ncbi:hypothetical protein ACPXA8_27970, partial [Klebsiella pneumoniae]|uniref:hypothetical protein n=1 Tax=Klebsiella pneumoniae TaxID=573 RepID=UPI003CF9E6D2